MKTRVNQLEFAKLVNVNRATVHRWVKAGRIELGKDGLIDVAQAMRQRQATESTEPRHQARKAQFDDQKASQQPERALPGTETFSLDALGVVEKLSILERQARVQHLKAQAELKNLELDKAARAVYDADDVHYLLTDIGRTTADAWQSLADRYTSELVACKGDANAIHKALEDIGATELAALNHHQQRKTEELL